MKQKNKKKKERKLARKINNRLIKDRIISDIRTLFEQEKKDYYKPKRLSNFFLNNNYVEYESNADKNKNLLEEYNN